MTTNPTHNPPKLATQCYRDGQKKTYAEMIDLLRTKTDSKRYFSSTDRKFAATMIENLCLEIDTLYKLIGQQEK